MVILFIHMQEQRSTEQCWDHDWGLRVVRMSGSFFVATTIGTTDRTTSCTSARATWCAACCAWRGVCVCVARARRGVCVGYALGGARVPYRPTTSSPRHATPHSARSPPLQHRAPPPPPHAQTPKPNPMRRAAPPLSRRRTRTRSRHNSPRAPFCHTRVPATPAARHRNRSHRNQSRCLSYATAGPQQPRVP